MHCRISALSLAVSRRAGRRHGRRADRCNSRSANRPRRAEGRAWPMLFRRCAALGTREAWPVPLVTISPAAATTACARIAAKRRAARFQCTDHLQRSPELPPQLARQFPQPRTAERGGVARSAAHGCDLARCCRGSHRARICVAASERLTGVPPGARTCSTHWPLPAFAGDAGRALRSLPRRRRRRAHAPDEWQGYELFTSPMAAYRVTRVEYRRQPVPAVRRFRRSVRRARPGATADPGASPSPAGGGPPRLPRAEPAQRRGDRALSARRQRRDPRRSAVEIMGRSQLGIELPPQDIDCIVEFLQR